MAITTGDGNQQSVAPGSPPPLPAGAQAAAFAAYRRSPDLPGDPQTYPEIPTTMGLLSTMEPVEPKYGGRPLSGS